MPASDLLKMGEPQGRPKMHAVADPSRAPLPNPVEVVPGMLCARIVDRGSLTVAMRQFEESVYHAMHYIAGCLPEYARVMWVQAALKRAQQVRHSKCLTT